MNRRHFLRSTALVACAAGLRAQDSARHDRFGGLRALKFEATGLFRVERREGRWWFVTPEGHGWLGFGVNHVHSGWLLAPYNRAVWLQRFGAEKPGDGAWTRGVLDLVRGQVADIGYNHFGVHNSHDTLLPLGVPLIRPVAFVKINHSNAMPASEFRDVFAPAFERHCDALAAKECAPHRGDPLVIGWAFTDCPIFTDAEAAARPVVTHGSPRDACPTWPRVLRNLPASAPGKQAWLATIRARYADDVNRFNDCYGVSFASWDALRSAENWRELTDFANTRELADNRAFLEQVVERYYAIACAAVRKHAPHHLLFGDKLNGNTDGADAVVSITARHTDAVFYQQYDRWELQRAALDRWAKLSGGKPAFNGDGTFSTTTDLMPNPHGPHARDQAERGQWAFEFGQNAFARPDFIGWSVCGWVDTWRTMPRKEFKQHSGFFDPLGTPHADYVRRLRELSANLYDFARPEGAHARSAP